MAFLQDLVATLRAVTGPGTVIADEADMAPFLTDWRRLFQGKAACVVRPRTTEEVSVIVRECVSAGAAIVPQGGNTGLAGGATPDTGGTQVLLSLSRMDAIRDIDPTGLCVEVEAGAPQNLSLSLAAIPEPVEEAPAVVDPAPQAEQGGTNVVPYVLLGLAGAGAVVGGVFGYQALQAKSDFDGGERTSAKADSVDRNALVADMAFGAALTFGITGLVLLLTDDGTKEVAAKKGSSVQFSPYVGPQSAGAGAFMKF